MTDTKPLRSFGRLFAFILGILIPALVWYKNGTMTSLGYGSLMFGVLLLVTAEFHPKDLEKPYRAWMALARALNWVMTRLIVSVVFFGLITPIGRIRRWWVGDPHRFHAFRDPEAGSYWIRRSSETKDPASYRNQF